MRLPVRTAIVIHFLASDIYSTIIERAQKEAAAHEQLGIIAII